MSSESIVMGSYTLNITLMANNNNSLVKYDNIPLINIVDNYGPSCFTRHMNLLRRQEKLVS